MLGAVTPWTSAAAEDRKECGTFQYKGFPCSTFYTENGHDRAIITLTGLIDLGERTPGPDGYTLYTQLSVIVENVGTEPLTVEPNQFLDVDIHEGFTFVGGAEPPPGVVVPNPLTLTTLQPGDRIDGDVVFWERENAWEFFYRPEPNRLIPLDIHESGGGGAGSRPINIIGRRR
jgi:hypothetical protein